MLRFLCAPMLRALGLIGAMAALLASPGAPEAADGNVPGELVDATKFRVCADPNNLPYSNEAGEGFENKIAELLAGELGREVTYTWYPSTIGFVRNTLSARVCDVVIGTTIVNELMQNTNPYYRSTYALIQRADAEHQVGLISTIPRSRTCASVVSPIRRPLPCWRSAGWSAILLLITSWPTRATIIPRRT